MLCHAQHHIMTFFLPFHNIDGFYIAGCVIILFKTNMLRIVTC